MIKKTLLNDWKSKMTNYINKWYTLINLAKFILNINTIYLINNTENVHYYKYIIKKTQNKILKIIRVLKND